MLKKRFFLSSLFISLLMLSCGAFKEITVTHIDSFQLGKLSMTEIEGDLQLTIKNPNTVGFSIYRSEFDVIYGGVKLGKAKLHKRVRIGANSEKAYVFKIKSSPENLNLADLLKLAGNLSSATIQVKGELKAGKLFIRKVYPVNYTERINLGK